MKFSFHQLDVIEQPLLLVIELGRFFVTTVMSIFCATLQTPFKDPIRRLPYARFNKHKVDSKRQFDTWLYVCDCNNKCIGK